MSNNKKENPDCLQVFEKYIKQRKTTINLKLFIDKIVEIENTYVDKVRMGLINENSYDSHIQEGVARLINKFFDDQINVTANSKIATGKEDIVAVNYDEARALGLIYDINIFDNCGLIQCCVSANNQKCKAILKITPKIPSAGDFVLVSDALAKKIKLKNSDQITFNSIKVDTMRINLDEINSSNFNNGRGDNPYDEWDDEY